MTDREQMVAAYERAWTRRDESDIRADLERCLTAASTYVSPLTDVVRGVEGLTGLILDLPVMFPGARVRPTSLPDIHHDVAYFTWQLTSSTRIRTMGRDYGHTLDGIDFVDFDDEGRIRRVTAFFGLDRLAPAVPERAVPHRAAVDPHLFHADVSRAGTSHPDGSRTDGATREHVRTGFARHAAARQVVDLAGVEREPQHG